MLIKDGYTGNLVQENWNAFVSEATRTLPCPLILFQYQDLRDRQRSFVITNGLGDDFNLDLAKNQIQGEDDLFWQTMSVLPAGAVRLGCEIIEPEQNRDKRLFRQLAAPWNLEHYLMGVVSNDTSSRAFLSLVRTSQDPPFGPEDKELFGSRLLPKLRRDIEMQRWLGDLQRVNSLFSALVNQAPYGLVVTDGQGKPLITNDKAHEILTERDGLCIAGGLLEATDQVAQARLAASLAGLVRGGEGEARPASVPVLVKRPSGRPPLYVVVTPLGVRNEAGWNPALVTCAFVIHDQQPSPANTLTPAFVAVYRLSTCEEKLCNVLLSGRTLPEAAEHLAISRNTAKTHLSRIFDKTGVRSQNALLRLLVFGAQDPGSRL